MINTISIKNFRCYKDTTIKGFKRLNLIGGLNNAGKTVLLEAFFLNLSPTAQSIMTLKQLRGESVYREDPEYSWENFFLNQERESKISIRTKNDQEEEATLGIDCDEKVDDFKRLDDESTEDNDQSINSNFPDNEQILQSVLHLNYTIKGKKTLLANLIANKEGMRTKDYGVLTTTIKAKLIAANLRTRHSILARQYEVAEKKGQDKDILDAVKIIDSTVNALRVAVVGGNHIKIRRDNENFMSASLFGDAINKILTISLNIINSRGSVILIDEIENGIHHTVQRDFWRFLFTLAEKSDVQIFATTHSLEMLKAFADVSKDFADNGAYLELFRRKSTNEIDFNLHNLDTLNYELSNEIAVRGE
jgi:AAA15 family ATPase/GTPase